MKKKNGFTLIELLAVIVILAIIALIATPIVLNLINKAREGAAKDSAYGVRKAAQLYYQTLLLDNSDELESDVTITFNNGVATSSVDLEFNINGTKPSGGSITISKYGEISGDIAINGFGCEINNSDLISCNKYKKYANGEIVYFNPITNETCDNYHVDNSKTEYKGNIGSKTTDNQNGCLKWYAYLDSESSRNVRLMLDHNTYGRLQLNNDNNNQLKVLDQGSNIPIYLEKLKNDYQWEYLPEIISSDDIALMVKYNNGESVNWDQLQTATKFFFDTATRTFPTYTSTKRSKYAWLYNYTYGCANSRDKDYGCEIEDNNKIYTLINTNSTYKAEQYGYWTSTSFKTSSTDYKTIYVSSNGTLSEGSASSTGVGLRPVITVSKAKLN